MQCRIQGKDKAGYTYWNKALRRARDMLEIGSRAGQKIELLFFVVYEYYAVCILELNILC
jgi:hypothetical protein